MAAAGLPCRKRRRRLLAELPRLAAAGDGAGPRSPSAARGGGIAHTREELARASSRTGSRRARSAQVLVERSLRAGRVRARGDVDPRATAWSSARSRTSTRWASTPATRGRSRRSRRCPTRSTSGCGGGVACARAVGVATGGANVQFAYDQSDARLARDRDEPARLALVGARLEGDGFPIAKLAALLAVGYTLDELPNDITGKTTAAFEPALDYVAVKAPRFDFAKFPGADAAARHGDARRRRGARARADVPGGVPEGARRPRGRSPSSIPARRARPRLWDPLLEAAAGSTCRSTVLRAERAIAAAERSGDARAAKRFGLPDAPSRACSASTRRRCAAAARSRAGSPSTRARPSSRRGRRTSTSRTSRATTSRRASGERSSCSAPARTGSARGSSSTTAASTRRRRSAGSATRR